MENKRPIGVRSKIVLGLILFFSFCVPGPSLIFSQEGVNQRGAGMKLLSPDFQHEQMIPVEFTCQGEDVSPALQVEDIPPGTQTLALIVDDPDAPVGTWVHWIVYDIRPKNEILRAEIPGIQGMNDFRKPDYGGPCPPSGTHRYFFKLYALDKALGLKPGETKDDLLRAMEGHILGQAQLVGRYKRK